jgi:pyruvate,water dikinase
VIQSRLNLKGHVTEVYSQLLAHLRWSFVALERSWLQSGLLSEAGDIFFLEFSEIRRLVADDDRELKELLPQVLEQRRSSFGSASLTQLEHNRQLPLYPP